MNKATRVRAKAFRDKALADIKKDFIKKDPKKDPGPTPPKKYGCGGYGKK